MGWISTANAKYSNAQENNKGTDVEHQMKRKTKNMLEERENVNKMLRGIRNQQATVRGQGLLDAKRSRYSKRCTTMGKRC